MAIELKLWFLREIILLIEISFNRRDILEKKLADADVSEEDQNNLLKFLEQKETEYMRLQRHKMGADDFELLTMIGKGAFGEVFTILMQFFCGLFFQLLIFTQVLCILVFFSTSALCSYYACFHVCDLFVAVVCSYTWSYSMQH